MRILYKSSPLISRLNTNNRQTVSAYCAPKLRAGFNAAKLLEFNLLTHVKDYSLFVFAFVGLNINSEGCKRLVIDYRTIIAEKKFCGIKLRFRMHPPNVF